MTGPIPATTRRRSATATAIALAAVAVDVAVAVGLGLLRYANATAGQHSAEGMLPTAAMAVAFLAPGVIAVTGLATSRPVLLCAAGIACFPLALLSIAALPIWVSGTLFLVAFARAGARGRQWSAFDAAVAGAFPLPILAGLWILVTRTRQYHAVFANGRGSEGGDYFTPAHALLCIALVAVDVVFVGALAWSSAGRRRRGA